MELVRAGACALNAGDLDRWIEFFAPDVRAFPDLSVWPESRPLHGRAEYLSFMNDVRNAWTQLRIETAEVFAVGVDRVLLRGDLHAIGAGSGITVTTSLTTVSTVRAGQLARVEYYFDHDRALRAAGLKE